MSNQDVFDMLSELECFFYYKRDCLNPTLDEIHAHVNAALLAWSEYSGCTNDTKVGVVTGKIDAIRLLLECCPDSPLVPIWEKALAELEAIPL